MFRRFAIKRIYPEDLPQDGLILDVRTKAEHDELALVQHHYHVDINSLDVKAFLAEHHLIEHPVPIYILCHSGMRAERAAHMFRKAGYAEVLVINGGIIVAASQRLPLTRP